eukprot:GFUD01017628.1.p1 GENE.GFUD01017628.1~~GFUD01017628.1.p1  ORF type:complete len:313 (-),score=59.49 GFUD01017628.1:104-1042(-)
MLAIYLLSLLVTVKASSLDCPIPVVCDPIVGILASYITNNAATCEKICHYSGAGIGGGVMGCKFFTYWNREGSKENCHFLTECSAAVHAPGAHSGLWSCADDTLSCAGAGEVPAYDDKATLWTCDYGYAYGGNTRVSAGATCSASCPSFLPEGSQSVSTTCEYSAAGGAVWGTPTPPDVTAADGQTKITNPEENPTIPCGCADLVLEGEIEMQDDNGLQLTCTGTQPSIAEGKTTFTQDTECILLCDGVLTWDLYCSQGEWSVSDLNKADDVKCYGSGEYVTLSTWFSPTTTIPAEDTTTTVAPVTPTTARK